MSIEAMNWALNQQTGSPTAKAVLLILANRANESGKCYPGIDGISEQTEISRRTVIRKIQELVEGGFIEIEARGGDGSGRKSNLYRLRIGAKCQSDTLGQSASVTGQCATGAGQSATVTPEPKERTQRENPKSRARTATRIPEDFELTDERRLVAEAETLPADRTFAKFRDYWLAASGTKARKHDWEATWRNWCRNEADWNKKSSHGTSKKLTYAEQLRQDMIASGQTEGLSNVE